MTRDERAAVRVRDEHWFLRDLERIERRAVPAMGDIDRHADAVHALDDRDPEITEPFVTALGRAVADEVATVVRQLRDTLTKSVERIDVIGSAKVLGVLNAEDDADLSGGLDAVEVGRAVDAQKILVGSCDK